MMVPHGVAPGVVVAVGVVLETGGEIDDFEVGDIVTSWLVVVVTTVVCGALRNPQMITPQSVYPPLASLTLYSVRIISKAPGGYPPTPDTPLDGIGALKLNC
jgi:hypothetical protein